MMALETAAEAMSGCEIAWLDFDRFLESPVTELGKVAAFLGCATTGIEAIARGPLMRRYSKAVEYEYSPALRRDLIADATRRHDPEIADALAMLNAAAEKSPLLTRALARCGES
jgi:hypothetical protein